MGRIGPHLGSDMPQHMCNSDTPGTKIESWRAHTVPHGVEIELHGPIADWLGARRASATEEDRVPSPFAPLRPVAPGYDGSHPCSDIFLFLYQNTPGTKTSYAVATPPRPLGKFSSEGRSLIDWGV